MNSATPTPGSLNPDSLTRSDSVRRPLAFNVMTKPIGPICNLDCKYCFYLEKEKLYPDQRKWKMPDDVLEEYIRQYIHTQDVPTINFAWQGGEPTLLGVDYFRNVVRLQQKYANGKTIENAFQTNGTLLDDEWCEFFSAHRFLIGLSIDGPRDIHDKYRYDKKGNGTFDEVMRGVGFLKKHKTEFNTLTVVNSANVKRPTEVYRFLKDIGSGFIQFIPIVERLPTVQLRIAGMDLSDPPVPGERPDPSAQVTAWSVPAAAYGVFLIEIFEDWVRRDVGKTFVQIFDVALGNWMNMGSGLCVFAEKCGNALAIEHNGDLYSCDHYVYPRYKLGNIMNSSLGQLVTSPEQIKFGNDKADTLPQYCRKCEVKFACNGECPKHRFTRTPDGEEGLNYLCPSYKKFFNHVDPYMKTMASLLQSRQPAAAIMRMIAGEDARKKLASAKPNDPCPCGSGKKFKKCHGV